MKPSHLSLVSEDRATPVDWGTVKDEAIFDYWSVWARSVGLRQRTIDETLIFLRAMLRRTGKTILTVSRHDLILDTGREGIAPVTIRHYKSTLRSFFTWVQDEGFRLDCPAARLPKTRVVKPEVNPVTTEDLQQLIDSGIYARARTYVLLYAYQGFRASEIAAVSGEAIDWQRRRILSVEGKGGREVWRPMHPIVWAEAQKYPREGHWFPSPTTGRHVTGRNVSAVIAAAMKRAGMVGHRPHHLRGWYATEMSAGGASTAVVAAGLRHADMQSVSRYLAVSQEAIAEAQERLPVISVPERAQRRRAA